MDNRTQDFIPLDSIENGMVITKNGSVAMIIQTSAVNFDLLSENEQMAIIGSFAGLLNSLSFSIEIVIRSKKLDISAYLEKLVKAEAEQSSPLLKKLMQNYRSFVSSVIRENEVLDKQFFVVISISSLEVGVLNSISNRQLFLQKALTALTPRRDHIMRQLGRIGLKASQLDDEHLVKLFYDWYNEPVFESMEKREEADKKEQAMSQSPAPSAAPPVPPAPAQMPAQSITQVQQPASPSVSPPLTTQAQPAAAPPVNPYPNVYPARQINMGPVGQGQKPATTPFVVEELHDDYGTAR